MITDQVPVEESSAARGALWITVGMVSIGLSNYGYSLLLTHLLSVSDYSIFSAGQSLILWATNIATVSVPWVLAQALVRARSDSEYDSAIRFAKVVSVGSGILAGIIVAAISARLSGPVTALVIAASTFVIFLGTATTGWLQGEERMRSLSLLYISENVLKNGAGIFLVAFAGLRGNGALAAFGIGGLAMLVRWPRTRSRGRRSWRELVNRELLSHAIASAGTQGLVSLFIAVDVVLIALLPGNRALAASYQASATLTRIPLYIAGAVATAYFPALSRRGSNGVIAGQAIRLYATTGLPLMAILATIPGPLVTKIFPADYSSIDLLLRYTAITGFAAGGISLITTFFQAASEYSCLKWLSSGLVGYVVAIFAGWRMDGVVGLAAGGALGSAVALVLISFRLVRSRGLVVLAWVRPLEPAIACAVLVLARSYWFIWLAAAFVFGLRAALHFLRPGSSDDKLPTWATSRGIGLEAPVSVTSLLIDAIWRQKVPEVTDDKLSDMLALARTNGVEGKLAQLYPGQLPGVFMEVQQATNLYSRVLREAARRLREARIPAVFIEDGLSGFRSRGSIDLVIPRRYWRNVSTMLPEEDSIYIQRTDRILLHPPAGPSISVYPDLSWLGVSFLETNLLVGRAVKTRDGLLVPSRVDYLRILFGHALSQQSGFDLSQLVVLWGLLCRPAVIMAARAEAGREGWLRIFDETLAVAAESINSMQQGEEIGLPVPPPVVEERRIPQRAYR